ncbi:MAG TPA: hypothetical protein VFF06_31590 [Polyangia bacterium]|nr:hypothetical protein [Polyangia bacterium]
MSRAVSIFALAGLLTSWAESAIAATAGEWTAEERAAAGLLDQSCRLVLAREATPQAAARLIARPDNLAGHHPVVTAVPRLAVFSTVRFASRAQRYPQVADWAKGARDYAAHDAVGWIDFDVAPTVELRLDRIWQIFPVRPEVPRKTQGFLPEDAIFVRNYQWSDRACHLVVKTEKGRPSRFILFEGGL